MVFDGVYTDEDSARDVVTGALVATSTHLLLR